MGDFHSRNSLKLTQILLCTVSVSMQQNVGISTAYYAEFFHFFNFQGGVKRDRISKICSFLPILWLKISIDVGIDGHWQLVKCISDTHICRWPYFAQFRSPKCLMRTYKEAPYIHRFRTKKIDICQRI